MDGPGRCGKTYLYSTLLSYFRGNGDTLLLIATPDIASKLMKGGRTHYRGFKLPDLLLDTSVSSMRIATNEAEELRKAKETINDEITMLTKDGLLYIGLLLRNIMINDEKFEENHL